MKIAVELTNAKNPNEGITQVARNLLGRLDKDVEIVGGSFITLRNLLKKWLIYHGRYSYLEYYHKYFPTIMMRIHRQILPLRFNRLFEARKYSNLLGTADAYVFFFNNLPKGFEGKNNIVFIHDLTELKQANTPKARQKRFNNFKYSIANATMIITDSEFSKNEIIEYFPEVTDKIKVLYCGVDSKKFTIRADNTTLNAVKAKYNLPNQYILFVGQPRANKNLERLMRAYAQLPTNIRKDYGLVLANTNESLLKLRDELQLGNQVCMLHGIASEDLVAVYQGARIVTLVSTNEGFGLPIIEAMAASVPVLCSNVSCLPEVAGGAALTVDPYNIDAITNGLVQLLTDEPLRTTLVTKGQQRAKDFTWEKTAKQFNAYLQELVGGNDQNSI